MPFSSEFLTSASRPMEVESVASDFAAVKAIIENAIKEIAADTPYVLPKQADIYIHGSYANATNIYFPSNMEICVELKKTATYDPETFADYRVTHNYFIEHNLDFSPKDFRELLFTKLSANSLQKLTENDKCIIMPASGKLRHVVEITPCFTFNYKEEERPIVAADNSIKRMSGAEFRGVLLYDRSEARDIVTFPKIHAQNGNMKDTVTGGNFKKIVRLFKCLNVIHRRESELDGERGYFIECLLYNVPDLIFRGSVLSEVFIKVLNYLLNCDIENFVCQNLVWQLFGMANEFWSVQKARNFIISIKQMYNTFPENRTLLA